MALDPDKPIGPIFRKLAIHKLSLDVTSDGKGFLGALKALQSSDLSSKMKTAFDWADDQIKLVRTARDADPNWTDEDIAKMIMDGVEARSKSAKAKQ